MNYMNKENIKSTDFSPFDLNPSYKDNFNNKIIDYIESTDNKITTLMNT